MTRDSRSNLCKPVFERLDADEADSAVGQRLGYQMLSGAKSNFQADLDGSIGEERRQGIWRGRRDIDQERRENRLQRVPLSGAKSLALTPTEERSVVTPDFVGRHGMVGAEVGQKEA
jgi:hypothetical protein